MDQILALSTPLSTTPGPVRFDQLGSQDAGCLHELFEAQVALRPHAPALYCDGEVLSYAELEARANRLARYLRLHGAGPGTFVGLYLERSMAPIVAILAVLKAGAAYVPLDPAYPGDRIRHILTEAEPVLLLTEQALGSRARELYRGEVVVLDDREEQEEIACQSARPLSRTESGVSPSDLCYVIYTSGTTGRPKGVMTEHRGAFRFVLAFNEVCGTAPEDRVYQGFSLGFDGSVEEIWMAFSNGSALVVGTPQTPRFGDDLAQFLTVSGVTYLSTVPTLLSTMNRGVDTLRWLVVSGETCPPELVNRWARQGLRMLNVYGPTEATVNTTAAECIAGEPVTIGRPLPGYKLHILDAELRPVRPGEKGELFIAGETLSRGYLRQPELSAERFVRLSDREALSGQRLYRTGDLVRENARGELEFFGRIDSQVKIRGYRVELAEIESVLLEDPSIRSASVKLVEREGIAELAAYVVAKKESGAALDRRAVLEKLQARLPPYMLPSHLDVLDALPMLSSGKVDRARLPVPVCPLVREGGQFVAPASELEAKIAAVWARVFGRPQISVEEDFFYDLGGHSLLAAQMVTHLRKETNKHVAVRDAYRFPTVRKLAAHLGSMAERAPARAELTAHRAAPSSRVIFESQPRWVRRTTALLQLLSTYLLYGVGALPLGLTYLLITRWLEGRVSPMQLLKLGSALLFLTWPVLMAMSIAAKWLIIGRYRAGAYPLWGFYFFRFWLVNRLSALSGAGALAGTPLLPLYYRLMGAKVGRNCTLDTAQCSIWDLVRIGDDTSIGADTQLLGYRVENGLLWLGRVTIGNRCFIGLHSVLGLDTRMEDDARLDDQSLLADRQAIPSGAAYRGAPAAPGEVPLPETPAPRRHPVLLGGVQLLLMQVLALLSLLGLFPLFSALYTVSLLKHQGTLLPLTLWLLTSPLWGILLSGVIIALLKNLVLRRGRPGVYPLASGMYIRKWLSDGIMRGSRASLLPLYTTLYLPPWLRLLGAKIGARAELSTVWYFAPELVEVSEESFFADGSIIGGRRCFRGHFMMGKNRIGRRSFVGNSAILPVGTGLGDKCLLGVQSIPPVSPAENGACTPDGTEWLGSPAFSLPHRPKVGNFDDTVTFRPTLKLYVQRALIDGLRILIPGYIGLSSGIVFVLAMNFLLSHFGVAAMLTGAPLCLLALGLYATLLVAGLKKLVMGTFKPVIKPLWSMYVWLNEMVNGAYESVMAPAISPYLGTPYIAPLLRLLGCKIGRHTYIDTTLFSEFDLVEIGDYAALNVGAVIQNHLFEDRVMKSSHLKIGAGCSVGNMAVVLYDSEMQEGAALGPLSLLMKGETLPPAGRFNGIPCMQEPEPIRETHSLVRTFTRLKPMPQQRANAPAA